MVSIPIPFPMTTTNTSYPISPCASLTNYKPNYKAKHNKTPNKKKYPISSPKKYNRTLVPSAMNSWSLPLIHLSFSSLVDTLSAKHVFIQSNHIIIRKYSLFQNAPFVGSMCNRLLWIFHFRIWYVLILIINILSKMKMMESLIKILINNHQTIIKMILMITNKKGKCVIWE
jgi:hypothetical protein